MISLIVAIAVGIIIGDNAVDEEGVPPGNDQFLVVTFPVDKSENVTVLPIQGVVLSATKFEVSTLKFVIGVSHTPRP